jgi:hypothetical protein
VEYLKLGQNFGKESGILTLRISQKREAGMATILMKKNKKSLKIMKMYLPIKEGSPFSLKSKTVKLKNSEKLERNTIV